MQTLLSGQPLNNNVASVSLNSWFMRYFEEGSDVYVSVEIWGL